MLNCVGQSTSPLENIESLVRELAEDTASWLPYAQ